MCKNKGKYCYNNQENALGFCDYCIKEGYGKAPEKKKEVVKKLDQKQNKELRAKVGKCQINSPVCTGKADGVHHQQKREGKNLTDLTKKKVSCNPCNDYVEKHPQWAIKNGHSISKHKKTA